MVASREPEDDAGNQADIVIIVTPIPTDPDIMEIQVQSHVFSPGQYFLWSG
jgi:hypothetical protein